MTFNITKSEFRNGMKILLRYFGLNARASLQGLVEAQLRRLEGLAAIASARVILERQHEARPAYRVQTLLEVPGPDVHAEARDHTLQAALLKVVKDLERQIRSRKNRQTERLKRRVRLGLMPGLGSMRLAGHRA
jgi:ribosomal subunit interface protein